MTELILVRHGQTDWTKDNRIQGTLDIPLNKEGEREPVEMAKNLNMDIDVIYTSQLSRAHKTADILVDVKKLKIKPKRLKELNEINQGIWQGLLVDEVRGKRYKKIYSRWESQPMSVKPPQGESLAEAHDRVIPALQKIVRKHPDKKICLVTHKVVIALIKSYYLQLDINNIWEFLPNTTEHKIIKLDKKGNAI